MKKLFAFIVFLFSLGNLAQAQFVSLYGTSNYESSRSIIPFDSFYYLSATTGANSSAKDGVISKLTRDGEVVWSKKYGNSGDEEITDIMVTKDSCIVFVGYSTSSNWDGWIVKIDRNGNVLWSKKMGGASNEFFRTVTQSSDSGYLIGAGTQSYGGMGGYNAWFIKLDKNGNLVWNKILGGSQTDYGMYPIEIPSGNILWTFYSDNSSGSYGGFDWNLAKFDANGNLLGQYKYGSTGHEGVRDFKKGLNGNYWIIGETSKYSIGKGMLIQVDSTGDQVARALYQTGSSSHLDFYTGFPTADSGLIAAGYLGVDAIFIKVDKNMNVQWTKTYSKGGNQLIWNSRVTDDKWMVFSGYSSESGSNGGQDVLVIQMDSAGMFDCRDHSYSASIYTPQSGHFNWASISLSPSSNGTVNNYSISTSNFTMNRIKLNLDSDSVPINLDGGQPTIKTCVVDSTYLFSTNKAISWQWSTGSDTSFTYVSQPDTVWVYANRGYCYNADTAIIEYRDSLKLSAGYDTLLCHGEIFTFTGSATGGLTSKYAYTWRDSASNHILHYGAQYTDTFFTPTTLKLSLWDSCGLFTDSVYYGVKIRDSLRIFVPSDTVVCAGQVNKWWVHGTGGKSNSYAYSWKDNLSIGDTISIASDTTITLFAVLNDGCSEADTGSWQVITRPPISVQSVNDTTLCQGQSVNISISASGGDSSYTYTWNNSLGNGNSKTLSPSTTTNYECVVSDGCTNKSDTARFTINMRQSLSVVTKPDTTVCQGEVFNLYALGSGGYPPNYRFDWNQGLDTGQSQQVSFDSTISLQVILSDQCTVDPDTANVVITVRDFLSLQLPNDTTLCEGQSVTLTASGSGGLNTGYSFSWDNGLGNGASKTVTPDTTTMYKVVLSDACSEQSDSDYVQVQIRPELSISMRTDTLICRGESVYLYATASGGDSTYNYSWNQGITASHPPLVSPSHSITYRLIVSDNCTAEDDTAEVNILVRDSLSVIVNTDTTICRGESAQLRANMFGGYFPGYALSWNQALNGDSSHIVSPDYTTQYQVIFTDNCTSKDDTADVTVTVRDSLSVTPRQDTTICIGESVLLHASGSGGLSSSYSYSWNQGVGTGNYLSVSPDTTTTYEVILRDNCTSNPDTAYVTIVVRDPLAVTPRSDTTICVGQSVLLHAHSSGGYSTNYELSWNQGVGTGNYLSVSPSTSTRYEVILRDYCTSKADTATVDIIVRNPLTVLERSDTLICIGQSVNLYALGLGGDSSTYVFTWNQNIDTGRVVNVSPDTTTTYQLILSDGCTSKNDTTEVTINVRMPLDITERGDTFVCVGEMVRLYAEGAGGFSSTYSYTWDNGLDTGNANIVDPPVTTTYQVILRDGCTTNPDTGWVTVFVRKPLTLIKRTDTLICVGEEVELYFDGTGGDSLHYTFIWDHGGGTGNYRKVNPDTTTTYTVHLTDNCTLASGIDSVTVEVRSPLVLEARMDSILCIGEGIHLYSNQYGGFSPNYELTWNQGIGIDTVPLVFPDTTTTYEVILRDYCTVKSDTDYVTITVRDPLEVTQREDTLICIGEPVRLYASGTGGIDTNFTFTWDHGLDTGQQNIVYPDSTTAYQVILSDACTVKPDTAFLTVLVRLPLSVTPRSDTLICIGESVQLYADGDGGDSTYFFRWDNGLDTVDAPLANPEVTTQYEVILRDACTIKPDTAYMTVFVRDSLMVSARTDTTICVGETVSIFASKSGGDSLTHELTWNQGAGVVDDFIAQPGVTTLYQVILRDYCTTKSDTDYVTITVRDSLKIIPRTDTTICIGQSVNIFGTASGGHSPGYVYSWNQGLSTGNIKTVSPALTTKYQLILSDNCTLFPDTTEMTVNVRQPLQLTVRTDSFICQGESVILYASASGGDSLSYNYEWNQGIGSAVNPVVSPTVNTNYFVRLTDNCTTLDDTASVNIDLPVPLSLTKSNDTLVCRNSPVILAVVGSGGLPAQYDFAWKTIGNGAQRTVSPLVTTTYVVEFSDNCAIPVQDSITVNVQIPLVPGFTWDPEWGCVPNEITFEDTTTGSQDCWFRWEYGDGTSDTGTNLNQVQHSFDNVGDYQVRLLLKSPLGCLDTSSFQLFQIHPDPEASFTYKYDDNSNTDMTLQFTSTSKGAQDYFWDYGDFMIDEYIQNPSHSFADPGLYIITHTVVNQWGCADSTIDTIDVKDTYRVFMPNAFTPGGSDTLNNVFGPIGTGIQNYELSIYDRWGELVYFSDQSLPWDGKHQRSDLNLPSGMYVYILRIFSTRDVKKTMKGIVYVIR